MPGKNTKKDSFKQQWILVNNDSEWNVYKSYIVTEVN